jgi:hypothetical protein
VSAGVSSRPTPPVLEAVLKRLTYVNEETGYTVAGVATGLGSDLLTVVGALLGRSRGRVCDCGVGGRRMRSTAASSRWSRAEPGSAAVLLAARSCRWRRERWPSTRRNPMLVSGRGDSIVVMNRCPLCLLSTRSGTLHCAGCV